MGTIAIQPRPSQDMLTSPKGSSFHRGSRRRVRQGNVKVQTTADRLLLFKSGGGGGSSGGSGSGSGSSGGHYGGSGGAGSDYKGCLDYTTDELNSMWLFKSEAPPCQYFRHNSTDDNNGRTSAEDLSDDDFDDDDFYTFDDDGASGNTDTTTYSGGNSNDDGNVNEGKNAGDEEGDGDYEVAYEVIAATNYTYDDDGDNNVDYTPLEDFNITQCDTYDNLWVWDLSLTCESEYTSEGCECTFTQSLLDEGTVTCSDIHNCPKDCQICHTCFEMLGCRMGDFDILTNSSATSRYIAIAAAILVCVFGSLYYHTKHRKSSKESLDVRLIEEPAGGTSSEPLKRKPYYPGIVSSPSDESADPASVYKDILESTSDLEDPLDDYDVSPQASSTPMSSSFPNSHENTQDEQAQQAGAMSAGQSTTVTEKESTDGNKTSQDGENAEISDTAENSSVWLAPVKSGSVPTGENSSVESCIVAPSDGPFLAPVL